MPAAIRTRPARPTHQRHPRPFVPCIAANVPAVPGRSSSAVPVVRPVLPGESAPGSSRRPPGPHGGAGGPPGTVGRAHGARRPPPRCRGAPRALPGPGRRRPRRRARARSSSSRGPNGAGKTTLLRVLRRPGAGHRGRGRGARPRPAGRPPAVRRRVGLLGHANALYDDLTVAENVRFWARAAGATAAEADAALDRPRRWPAAWPAYRSRRLSAGQRRRTALAALVARRPELWLLDEPHAGARRRRPRPARRPHPRGRRRRGHRRARPPRARAGRAAGRTSRSVRRSAGGRPSSRLPARRPRPGGRSAAGAERDAAAGGGQGPAHRGPQPGGHQPGAALRRSWCSSCSPSPSTPTAACCARPRPGLFWVAVLFAARARRPALGRARGRRRRARRACASPASTRPASSSARPAPWPPSCSSLEVLLGVGVVVLYDADLRAGGIAAARWPPSWSRPSAWPPPVPSTARSPPACGCARPCSRCSCCRSWRPCSSAPPGPFEVRARQRRLARRRTAGPGSGSRRVRRGLHRARARGLRVRCWRTHERSCPPWAPATTAPPGIACRSVALTLAGLGWRAAVRPGAVARRRSSRASPCGSLHPRARRRGWPTSPFGVTALAQRALPRGRAPARRRGTAWPARRPRSACSSPACALLTGSIWGQPHLGRVVDVGRPPHHHRPAVPAVPRLPGPAPAAGRRPTCGPSARAIAGLIAVIDVPIVHITVEWWRTLHQDATVAAPRPRPADRRADAVHAVPRRRGLHAASTSG